MTTTTDTAQYDAATHLGNRDQASAGEGVQPGPKINLSPQERQWSAAIGAGLVWFGVRRRSLGGLLLAGLGGGLVRRGWTGHCDGYALLGKSTARPAKAEAYFDHGIHVEHSVTINKTPWELYAYWRNLSNLPTFMKHLERVIVHDDRRSHWIVKGPAGMQVEWDAEVINDEPNALIAWRSLANATVDNAGSVRFVPGPEGRGTEVRVVLDYIPPAGRFGAAVAYLFGENPTQQVKDDLRRFKQMMETGEVPTIEGQARGSCTSCE